MKGTPQWDVQDDPRTENKTHFKALVSFQHVPNIGAATIELYIVTKTMNIHILGSHIQHLFADKAATIKK